MKRMCAFLAILLLLSTAAAAAGRSIEKKKFEFSTAFSFEYNYESEYYSYSVLNLPVRLGFFLWKGLELEPELMFTWIYENNSGWIPQHYTGYLLSGDLLYNFNKKPSSRILPFILAGYGIGNGIPYAGTVDIFYFPIHRVTTLNLGAGLKLLFGNTAALRLEYRFRKLRYKLGYAEDDLSSYTAGHHGIYLGLSLFL